MGRPLRTSKRLTRAISANNDQEIGQLLADALERVGKDGVITVEEGKAEQRSTMWMGCSSTRATSLYFITDPGPWKRISRTLSFFFMKEDQQHPRPSSVAGEIRSNWPTVADHRRRRRCGSVDSSRSEQTTWNAKCLCCEAPGFGDRRKSMLGDIATLTGGTLISDDLGIQLENVTLDQLGRARKSPSTRAALPLSRSRKTSRYR